MPQTLSPSAATARIVAFFEKLAPAHLYGLELIYSADARFKDPFNEVRGVPAIRKIFAHMFATLQEPRFVVTTQVLDGSNCFLTWNFHFAVERLHAGAPQVIRGASHLVFDEAGRICVHRDYWDAAEELYEKMPLLGSLMRWLKERTRA